VTTDLNTLLTALYVRIDDYLRPRVRAGRPPRLTDSELLTLAVAQVLLGVRSEARWLRLVPAALPGAFPYLPGQSGYNKRLRAALPLLKRVIRVLAADTDLWADPVWLVDSTPVECARSRPTVARSDLAGIAEALSAMLATVGHEAILMRGGMFAGSVRRRSSVKASTRPRSTHSPRRADLLPRAATAMRRTGGALRARQARRRGARLPGRRRPGHRRLAPTPDARLPRTRLRARRRPTPMTSTSAHGPIGSTAPRRERTFSTRRSPSGRVWNRVILLVARSKPLERRQLGASRL
jgi:hypothetical protein